MELAFGQYASLGPTTVWRAVPIFKGQLGNNEWQYLSYVCDLFEYKNKCKAIVETRSLKLGNKNAALETKIIFRQLYQKLQFVSQIC